MKHRSGAAIRALRSAGFVLLLLPFMRVDAQASAQTALQAFLASLQEYPAMQAAKERVLSARLALEAAYDPVSLSVTGSTTSLFNDPVDLDPVTPGDQGLPGSATNLSAAVTFRPFVFGDTADQADQRQIELKQAQLEAAAGLAQLEANALDAALALGLAQESLATATQGAQLAEASLSATKQRYANGAATIRELRNAQTGAAQAHDFVTSAEEGLALAKLSLASLVGDATPPDLDSLTDLPLPSGTPVSVQRADLNAALVEVGIRSARRSVYPVAQASYNWNIDDHNTVGIALESRTLQPKLSYSYSDPGTPYPQNATYGNLTIGVSAKISPGVFQGLAATDANLRAAQSNVEAAERAATVQRASLDNALAQARRTLVLERRKLDDARATLDEAGKRETLGLDIPLTTQNASLELTRQALSVRQARQDVFDKTLAYYSFYALPLSHVDASAPQLDPATGSDPTDPPEAQP